MHDRYRKDAGGQDTFARIMHSVQLLEQYHVDYNVVTVVTNDTAKQASFLYKFWKRNHYPFVQFIPCMDEIKRHPELKIVLVAVEIIVVIAAALALEQCGTGSENSDKGYISGEYSGGAQENIDYEAKTVAIDSGHGGIDPGKISADGILEKDVNLAIASKLKILLEQSGITVIMTRADDNGLYQER